MLCIKCKKELPDEAKFCIFCGAKQPKAVKCSKCGAKLQTNAIFCMICGEKVGVNKDVVEKKETEVSIKKEDGKNTKSNNIDSTKNTKTTGDASTNVTSTVEKEADERYKFEVIRKKLFGKEIKVPISEIEAHYYAEKLAQKAIEPVMEKYKKYDSLEKRLEHLPHDVATEYKRIARILADDVEKDFNITGVPENYILANALEYMKYMSNLYSSMVNSLYKIAGQKLNDDLYHELNRSSEFRFVGGGFGIEGAAKGILMAEGANLLLDAGRTIKNGFIDFLRNQDIYEAREELYKEGKKRIPEEMEADITMLVLYVKERFYWHNPHKYQITKSNSKRAQKIVDDINTRNVGHATDVAEVIELDLLNPDRYAWAIDYFEDNKEDRSYTVFLEVARLTHIIEKKPNLEDRIKKCKAQHEIERKLVVIEREFWKENNGYVPLKLQDNRYYNHIRDLLGKKTMLELVCIAIDRDYDIRSCRRSHLGACGGRARDILDNIIDDFGEYINAHEAIRNKCDLAGHDLIVLFYCNGCNCRDYFILTDKAIINKQGRYKMTDVISKDCDITFNLMPCSSSQKCYPALRNLIDFYIEMWKHFSQWVCRCGGKNTGKFCTFCGTPKPIEQEHNSQWVCRCGGKNTGKFCTFCGTPKPIEQEHNSQWVCVCGDKNTGKFCTSCGAPNPVKSER